MMVPAIVRTAVMGGVLLLGACGSPSAAPSAPPGQPGPTNGPGGSTVSTGDDPFAVLDGRQTHAAEDALHDATQELVRRCMTTAGFTFTVTPSTAVRSQREASRAENRHPWQRPTRADAAAGYPKPAPRPDLEDANRSNLARLSEAERVRWDRALAAQEPRLSYRVDLGSRSYEAFSPEVGCLPEAERRLFGDARKSYLRLGSVTSNLRGEAETRTTADRAYGKAERAWLDCLPGEGYRVADASAVASLAQELANSRAKQVALAQADASCAEPSALPTVGAQVFSKKATAVVREHMPEVLEYQRILGRAAIQAREALRG